MTAVNRAADVIHTAVGENAIYAVYVRAAQALADAGLLVTDDRSSPAELAELWQQAQPDRAVPDAADEETAIERAAELIERYRNEATPMLRTSLTIATALADAGLLDETKRLRAANADLLAALKALVDSLPAHWHDDVVDEAQQLIARHEGSGE